MNNYTILHLHSMLSNSTTVLDSITSYKEYIDKAVELNMKAIAFTEHGSVLGHINKKRYCNKKGIKYIHGIECYVTKDLDSKENYHQILLAKNYEGFLEINKLTGHQFAYSRDKQFYNHPRITLSQLKNTSDNIILTTACLGGILYSDNEELKREYIELLSNNKHRAFLELQPHNIQDQKIYNSILLKIHKKYNIPLVASNDVHALNKEHIEGRSVLQDAKDIHFKHQEGMDLTMKSYDELKECFEIQDTLSEDIYTEAIKNTNKIADMVQEWEFDLSKKYPKISNNPEKEIRKRIKEGLDKKGMRLTDKIKNRIEHEIEVFKGQKALDFLLVEDWVKLKARENNVYYGEGRGSIGGSLIAYLLEITYINPLDWGLYFERFMNPERQSEPDIDTDYYAEDIPIIKDEIYGNDKFICADIITYNRIKMRGAIRDVGRAFDMDLKLIDEIAKSIDEDEEKWTKEYPKLLKFAKLLNGTIISVSEHPAGVLISDEDIYSKLGTMETKNNDYPIVQIDMKEVEFLKYIKLDLLKLKNIGVVNKTCELANIERVRPSNLDLNDPKVYDNIIEYGSTGIFQLENEYTFGYLKKLISENLINKLKGFTGDETIDKFTMMAVSSSIIRPVGDKFRDDFSNGNFHTYGNKDLDKLLNKSGGYLIWQEQILEFLNKFCGYSIGEADLVRRGFAKKTGTEQFIPEIKKGFINHMEKEYRYSKEKSLDMLEGLIETIIDASKYLFNLSHNILYNYISYQTAYLRTYYPIEFITSALSVFDGSMDKVKKYTSLANRMNIEMERATFGKSKADYYFEGNTIYKGVHSIKNLNAEVGNKLYEMRDIDNFPAILDLKQHMGFMNKTHVETLIKVGYFRQFGSRKKLLEYYKVHDDLSGRKIISKDKLNECDGNLKSLIIKYADKETAKQYREINFDKILIEYFDMIPNDEVDKTTLIKWELEFLGYTNIDIPKGTYLIKVESNKYYGKVWVNNVKNSKPTSKIKVPKKYKMKKDQFWIVKLKQYSWDFTDKQGERHKGKGLKMTKGKLILDK